MTDVHLRDDPPPPVAPEPALGSGLRRVLEAAELAVGSLDPEGHVTSATSTFARCWDLTVDEIVGVHLVGLCEAAQRAEVTAAIVRMVEGTSEIEQLDATVVGADGTTSRARLTIGARPDPGGRTGSLLCAISHHRGARHGEVAGPQRLLPRRPTARPPAADTATDTGSPVDAALTTALRRSARGGRALSVLHCQITGVPEDDVEIAAEVLEVLSERIAQRVRPTDTVEIAGPDRFSVLAEDLGDEQDAAGVAYRLLSATVEPVLVGGAPIHLGLTIGLAVADGAASPAGTLDAAEAALREACRDGVGGFRMIDIRAGRAA